MTDGTHRQGPAPMRWDLGEPDDDPAQRLWSLWQQGYQPRVEDFLEAAGVRDPGEIAMALRVDQAERCRLGQWVSAEHYLDAFPAVRDHAESAIDLIFAEFLLREQRGEQPPLEEFLLRFPRHAGELKLVFEVHREMGSFSFPSHVQGDPGAVLDATDADLDQEMALKQRLEARADEPGAAAAGLRRLGGYRIEHELGRGGMGVVYRAFDERRGVAVALKTLKRADAAALLRFKQEFRTLADVSHPNLVALHELATDGPIWFFTMELIDGVSFLRFVLSQADPPAPVAATTEDLRRPSPPGIRGSGIDRRGRRQLRCLRPGAERGGSRRATRSGIPPVTGGPGPAADRPEATGRGGRLSPRGGQAPSRPETLERAGDPAGPCRDPRLRARRRARGVGDAREPGPVRPRHVLLHGAGTGGGTARLPGQRLVQPRHDALPGAHRPHPVPGPARRGAVGQASCRAARPPRAGARHPRGPGCAVRRPPPAGPPGAAHRPRRAAAGWGASRAGPGSSIPPGRPGIRPRTWSAAPGNSSPWRPHSRTWTGGGPWPCTSTGLRASARPPWSGTSSTISTAATGPSSWRAGATSRSRSPTRRSTASSMR